ncbi:MAG: transposase [Elusimicrobiota bacterium]
MNTRQTFNKEYKKRVVEEIVSGTITTAAASRKYGIVYQVIKHWQKAYELGRLDNELKSCIFIEG